MVTSALSILEKRAGVFTRYGPFVFFRSKLFFFRNAAGRIHEVTE